MKNNFVELPFHVLSAKDIAVPSVDIDDALISVECYNPRAMIYDEKHNLIRID